jgi:glycosyltransferase involved in cell wall biosynthesis
MCKKYMKKINMLFNADVLTQKFNKTFFCSGVFFAAYNCLQMLAQNKRFIISLCVTNGEKWALPYFRQDSFFSQFSCYALKNKSIMKFNIAVHKQSMKTSVGIVDKIMFIMKIIKNYLCIANYHLFNTNPKILKNIDMFFFPDPVFLDEIKKHPHIKCFGLLHDTMPLNFPEYFPDLQKSWKFFLNTLDDKTYCFCNSKCTKLDFLKYAPDRLDEHKMFVTYIASAQNFVPLYDSEKLKSILNKYHIANEKHDKYIFSLCTLEPRKNLFFTVGCFIKFIKKHNIQDLYFYLGGGQSEIFIKKMEEQINTLTEYRDKIVRLGYVDDEDVNILYSNSLFFTYLSQYEGFGMPPLEAMQAGTPVITSNNSSLPEVVGDAAITIDYNSEEQCIEAFEKLYFNEDIRKEYIAKGIERAKLFSWEKTVDKMTDVIMTTVSS